MAESFRKGTEILGVWTLDLHWVPGELVVQPVTAQGENQKMEPKEGRCLGETKASGMGL